MNTTASWEEWKKQKEAEYNDDSGQPLPYNARDMLAFNGRTPGKHCEECVCFVREEKRPWNTRCSAANRKGKWYGNFPACGIFQQKPEINGDQA